MRQSFPGYYEASAMELDEIWSNGLVVLDTNILLNLYRYSPETRASLLAILSSVDERLWLPYQVGYEFHRNRLEVIDAQANAFRSVIDNFGQSQKNLENELGKYKRHPSLKAADLIAAHAAALAPLTEAVRAAQAAHLSTSITPASDPLLQTVSSLYERKVGSPFSEKELRQIYADGTVRFEAKIPPGFSDHKKPEPDRYGDLVIWKQILAHAKETDRAVLFVTDDSKADWWRIHHGETLGPRPELIAEFVEHVGKRVAIYSPESFMRFAKERLQATVSDESLGEVERVSSADADLRAAAEARRDDLARQVRVTERQLRQSIEELRLAESGFLIDERRVELTRRFAWAQRRWNKITSDISAKQKKAAHSSDGESVADLVRELDSLMRDRDRASSELSQLERRLAELDRTSNEELANDAMHRAERFDRRLTSLATDLSTLNHALESASEIEN